MRPTLADVREVAETGGYRRVPVCREMLSDGLTTIQAVRRLKRASHHVFLLESAEPDERGGRYSFLGLDPTMEITCLDGQLRVRRGTEEGKGGVAEKTVDHPGAFLREVLAAHRSPQLEGMPPFAGGLVGYFSYDYLKYAEPVLRGGEAEHADFPDMDLMLFDSVIAFDSYRSRVVLISGVEVPQDGSEGKLEEAYAAAGRTIARMGEVLRHGKEATFEPLKLTSPLEPRFAKERYCEMVRKAKRYIHEGDVFQVVLSDPVCAEAESSLFDTYRLLRAENPSPYMFYLASDTLELAGASPETLAKLTDGRLFTYPLAGTRPRGRTPEEDRALEEGLLADEKELAEHDMLVDLGRNDLGRIAELGSVHVDESHRVLRLSHVMHIGSTVSAHIAEGHDAVDAVDAILPAGTLSGAPKIRACQIIRELEGRKRGVYGGAIGYLDFAGNLDTCIGIRLAYKKDGEVCVQSGAGIVADSVPEREFEECWNKARAVVVALEASEGGVA